MKVQCPICRQSDKTRFLNNRLSLYRCDSCLHVFTPIPREIQERYNDNYFQETHKNWFSQPNYGLFEFIYRRVTKLLRGQELRLLDAGCGKGDFLKYVLAKDPTAKLVGIDLTDNSHPRIRFIKGDILKEKIDDKFNVICNIAVAEYVDDPHLLIQRFHGILAPGGILLTMTINSDSLIFYIARLLYKIGIRTPHDRLYSRHHLQHYTNRPLRKFMEMENFDILFQKNHSFPLRAVDLPECSFLVKNIYKLSVGVIFLISSVFRCGMAQTIICKKRCP